MKSCRKEEELSGISLFQCTVHVVICTWIIHHREHDHVLILPTGQQKAFKGIVETVASSEVVLKISEKVVKPL